MNCKGGLKDAKPEERAACEEAIGKFAKMLAQKEDAIAARKKAAAGLRTNINDILSRDRTFYDEYREWQSIAQDGMHGIREESVRASTEKPVDTSSPATEIAPATAGESASAGAREESVERVDDAELFKSIDTELTQEDIDELAQDVKDKVVQMRKPFGKKLYEAKDMPLAGLVKEWNVVAKKEGRSEMSLGEVRASNEDKDTMSYKDFIRAALSKNTDAPQDAVKTALTMSKSLVSRLEKQRKK